MRDSARVSTAPYFVSSGPGAMTRTPAPSRTPDHVLAAALGEVVREEAPVADDEAERDRMVGVH